MNNTPQTWLDKARDCINFLDEGAEQADRVFQSAEAVTTIACRSLEHQGKEATSLNNVSNSIGDAGAVLSISRLPWDLGKLLLGTMFFEKNDNGSLQTQKNSAGQTSYVWSALRKIYIRVAMFASRVLSLTTWLRDKSAYHIDTKHVQNIQHAQTALVAGVSLSGLTMALDDALAPGGGTAKTYADITKNSLDLLSTTFNAAAPANNACGIAGAVISLLSGLSWLSYEFAWHQKM